MRAARIWTRPLPLFALALGLLLVVIASTLEVRSPTCVAAAEPGWFAVAFWGAGPLSVLVAAGGAAAHGIRRRWRPYRTLLAVVVMAALWACVGLYIVVSLVIGPCLS
jgi:hypothetical protein